MSFRAWVECRRPGYPYSQGRTLAIFAGLMVTIVVAAIDQTIVATALPQIASDLGGLRDASWVFGAFLLCQTVTVPIYGKLGDVYGRRLLLFVSIPLFLVGSLLCGTAQTMWQLILFRGVQGLGAGGVIPLALSTTAQIVPPRDRGRYQGLTGTAFATSAIVGPTIGGAIADTTTWRWIFLVNLPVGAAALVLVALTMPHDMPRRRHAIDYPGALLLAVGLGAILVALHWGGEADAWSSAHVLGAFALGIAVLGLLAAVERRTAEPIVPFALLREPIVRTSAIATFLTGFIMLATTAYLPLFVQGVIGTSATSAGVVLIPLSLASTGSMFVSAQIVQRRGRYRANMLAGSVVLVVGTALLWRTGPGTSRDEVIRDVVVLGIGSGAMMQLFVLAAQNAVAYGVLGTTTALVSFVRTIGTTAGVSLFGVILDRGLSERLRGHTAFSRRLPRAEREQLAAAVRPAFLLLVALAVVVAVVVLVGAHERPLRRSVMEEEPELGPA
jgi:EmrB/QacA subfamily drug resistance transporter